MSLVNDYLELNKAEEENRKLKTKLKEAEDKCEKLKKELNTYKESSEYWENKYKSLVNDVEQNHW